jgi:A/G-specific adenine glycosylase
MSPQPEFQSRHLVPLRRKLLSWYDQNRRDLPWRRTRDPYHIWVSEIMLQQTRVAVVIPRYEQFLQRFPSVRKLAGERETTVLAEWSGLGYYHRARNLHAAAKIIARAGKFPQNADAWRVLPGIGRYTSAAIASIAYNEPVAVLDGNVARVLRRLQGRVHSVNESWKAAQVLVDRQLPGDFNQAMMELGATICLPSQPQCPNCPIRKFCRTRGRGESVSEKPRQRKREITYALVRKNGSVRLVRRSQNASLMPGMWELPTKNSPVDLGELLFSLRHSITITNYKVDVIKPRTSRGQGRWVDISRLDALPLTGLAKKILRHAKIIQ